MRKRLLVEKQDKRQYVVTIVNERSKKSENKLCGMKDFTHSLRNESQEVRDSVSCQRSLVLFATFKLCG